MTITANQLIERLNLKSDDCEVVGDNVLRVTRRAGDRPFAVCIFDVSNALPESPQALTDYQDRVLGPSYFDDRRSLQWNNYLYFVLSKDRVRAAVARGEASWIEQDRAYGRKYVVSVEQLDSLFAPAFIREAVSTPQVNVLNEWMRLLEDAGLHEIVVSTNSYPQRIAAIEGGTTPATGRARSTTSSASKRSTSFIQTLFLEDYRPCPINRSFTFGKVNLLVGPNGTGKTSLLEAIELLYCGRTKRNPNVDVRYKLVADYVDGRSEIATHTRPPSFFRDCNSAWYGQEELRTNNLYLSFSQFNFLDTDAAVGFAEAADHLEENLSKLLVGSDTSRVWKDIEDMRTRVASRIRELEPLQEHITEELTVIDSSLAQPAATQRESASLRTSVDELLTKMGWLDLIGTSDTTVDRLVGLLSELDALCTQALACDWLEAPITLQSLSQFLLVATSIVDASVASLADLSTSRGKRQGAENQLARLGVTRELLAESSRVVTSNVVGLNEQLNAVRGEVLQLSQFTSTLDDELLTLLSSAHELIDTTLRQCDEQLVLRRQAAERDAQAAKESYLSFTRDRDRLSSLATELRDLARRIIPSQEDPDECPVCHTKLPPGVLHQHVTEVQGSTLDRQGQELLDTQHEAARKLEQIAKLEQGVSLLRRASVNIDMPDNATVLDAIKGVLTIRRSLEKAIANERQLGSELENLRAQGITVERSAQLQRLLAGSDVPLASWTYEAIEEAMSRCKHLQEDAQKLLADESANERRILESLSALVGVVKGNGASAEQAVSLLKERKASTEIIRDKLTSALIESSWSSSLPISGLQVEVKSLSLLLGKYLRAKSEEANADAARVQFRERRVVLQRDLEQYTIKLDRLHSASAVLDRLHSEHSLNNAVEKTLQYNRSAVNAIFRRIHAPAEFSGLGTDVATLIRETDGSEAKLSQVSTGQRAAFALAVFLSQNLQLQNAPPVVLIDDPIAHVDDLNALSFLDFLRELAITGGRQIFFATADDRLASLFERKFDFLETGQFCRFNLTR